MAESIPSAVPDSFSEDEGFLKALHHVLLEVGFWQSQCMIGPSSESADQSNAFLAQVEVLEGSLVCPETQKKFPIKEGIPSML